MLGFNSYFFFRFLIRQTFHVYSMCNFKHVIKISDFGVKKFKDVEKRRQKKTLETFARVSVFFLLVFNLLSNHPDAI